MGRFQHWSVFGVYAISNMTDYAMTKGAVIVFTKVPAKEAAPFGVTVNVVSFGIISANGWDMPKHSFTGRAGIPESAPVLFWFLLLTRPLTFPAKIIRLTAAAKKCNKKRMGQSLRLYPIHFLIYSLSKKIRYVVFSSGPYFMSA